MAKKLQFYDYESLTRPSNSRIVGGHSTTENSGDLAIDNSHHLKTPGAVTTRQIELLSTPHGATNRSDSDSVQKKHPSQVLRNGHALSYFGLFLFTAVVYLRPYEIFPALSAFKSMAFWIALATLAVFVPSQFTGEGVLVRRPREVNLLLLFSLAALLSIPMALSPGEAWGAFVDFSKIAVIFVIMVTVVRTERRWIGLLWLAFLVSVVLSVNGLNDYRLGRIKVGADRIEGVIGGLFENPNDMALHLVTMIPLALGFLFVARSLSKKMIYALLVILMLSATVITFSRGGFLGLLAASFVMAWKLGRRNRLAVVLVFILTGACFLAAAPSGYMGRLMSTFGGSVDGGSAAARQQLLLRSILVSLRHPLLGVGMNNFHIVSIHEQVSHNAYTQVSSEIGMGAMIIYVLLILSPLKRMRQVERETYANRRSARIYYLAVALQASLIGYMVSSFFASVAYLWYVYYLVAYAISINRIYEAQGPDGIFAGSSRATQGSKVSDRTPALSLARASVPNREQ